MEQNFFWKTIGFVFEFIGVLSLFIAWFSSVNDSNFLNMQPIFYFYNAIASGIFGLFFLIFSNQK